MAKGLVVILSGASSVGKGAIRDLLLNDPDLKLFYSISETTRPQRADEVDGKDYYFVTYKEFADSVKKKGVTDFKNKALIQKYIKAYKEILLAHYNKQISDKQALSLLGTFKTADDAKLSLADIVDITPNVIIEYSYDSVNYLWCIEVYSNSNLVSTSYELSEKDLFAKLNELKGKYNPTRIIHRDN